MKYFENMRKNVKVEPGWWPLPFVRVLRSHHVDYAHHVSYMCTPYASNVGDVPEELIHFTYVRQPGAYHIHDPGEMCFERSTVSHEYSVKRCENNNNNNNNNNNSFTQAHNSLTVNVLGAL